MLMPCTVMCSAWTLRHLLGAGRQVRGVQAQERADVSNLCGPARHCFLPRCPPPGDLPLPAAWPEPHLSQTYKHKSSLQCSTGPLAASLAAMEAGHNLLATTGILWRSMQVHLSWLCQRKCYMSTINWAAHCRWPRRHLASSLPCCIHVTQEPSWHHLVGGRRGILHPHTCCPYELHCPAGGRGHVAERPGS